MRLKYLLLISYLLLFISNCAKNHHQCLHNNWEVNGKISWHDTQNNNNVISYINWQQSSNYAIVTLYSTFNLKNLVLKVQDNSIDILKKNGSKPKSHDPELIKLQQNLKNLSFNIYNLSYWLLGSPNPHKPFKLLDNGFLQENWIVSYSISHTPKLHPTKIIIRNATLNSYIIKIAINN